MEMGLSTLAFAVHEHEPPGLEVRVNFGMAAGREATPAELEALGEQLLQKVSSVSIVSEERHEMDGRSEAAVHQVRIEISSESLPEDRAQREQLAGRLIESAERWAEDCIASRHVDLTEP